MATKGGLKYAVKILKKSKLRRQKEFTKDKEGSNRLYCSIFPIKMSLLEMHSRMCSERSL